MKRQWITGFFLLAVLLLSHRAKAQIDEDQAGAWYMLFYDAKFKESRFGVQGDFQFRNWDIIGDLEQLLLRSGLTYRPKDTDAIFTLGYANITTGAFGDSDATVSENRIYQEALLPQRLGKIVRLRHRFRYEQRFVESQDLRTRWRYALFLSVPLNKKGMSKGALYLALYNELFVNGERSIGDGRTVELFDRNRFYAALGYSVLDNLKIQLGWMEQTTDNWQKSQLQLSAHYNLHPNSGS